MLKASNWSSIFWSSFNFCNEGTISRTKKHMSTMFWSVWFFKNFEHSLPPLLPVAYFLFCLTHAEKNSLLSICEQIFHKYPFWYTNPCFIFSSVFSVELDTVTLCCAAFLKHNSFS
jgi:hypothetical protein